MIPIIIFKEGVMDYEHQKRYKRENRFKDDRPDFDEESGKEYENILDQINKEWEEKHGNQN